MNATKTRHRPAVTVDLAVFTIRRGELQLLAIERGKAPHLGRWALPGGHLEADETLEQAAERELHEETGVDLAAVHLEQLHAYSALDRDTRERVLTIAFVAVIPDPDRYTVVAGDDAARAAWLPVAPILDGTHQLAFDHNQIVTDAIERVRNEFESSMLATWFCDPAGFTVSELRQVYEIVWGTPLDQPNFSRKITYASGVVEATGEQTTRGGGRAAALYRRGPATKVYPPIPRPQMQTHLPELNCPLDKGAGSHASPSLE